MQRYEIITKTDELAPELEKLLKVLEALKANEQENGEARREVVIELQHLEARMKECCEASSASRTASEKMKKENTRLQCDVENAELSVKEMKDELQRWLGKIVQSPERKRQAIGQKDQLLEVIKGEVKELERQLGSAKSSKQAHRDLIQELKGMELAILIDLAAESQAAVRRLGDDQAKLAAADRQALQEASNATGAEREHRRCEDHAAGERKRWELELAAAQEEQQTAAGELRRLEREQREGAARIGRGERDLRELHEQREEERERAEAEVRRMVGAFRAARRLWMERHQKRLDELDMSDADGEEPHQQMGSAAPSSSTEASAL
jgi:chromosome segregation ATPase